MYLLNLNYNMEPKIWGPSGWLFLHSTTLNYPDKPNNYDKKVYHDFFNLLPYILPCDICKQNFKKHLDKYPIRFHLDSKMTLSRWLVTIHNLSNIEYKKPTISYTTFLNHYKKIYKTKNYQKYIYIVILAVSVLYFLNSYFSGFSTIFFK